MPRPPDVIMVVRHGARLDAADPTWHLHSPTPYDSPLTFGGWNQSRLLGGRIANILRSGRYGQRPSGRVRIAIHSSPFLRCLETSIGIAAGMAQEPPTDVAAKENSEGRARPVFRDALPSIREPRNEDEASGAQEEHVVLRKPILRVDAFLGEWLSPDYFEQITPPPDTPLMLLSAKAQLLAGDEFSAHQPTQLGTFSGAWSGLETHTAAADYNVTRHRSNTYSKGEASVTITEPGSHDSTGFAGFYRHPTPLHAVSSSDHIPHGFFSHAQDACVEVDRNWDSSREPLDWGDCGTLGEEWGDLHRRIRKGLTSLVSWYTSSPTDPQVDCANPSLSDDDLLAVILVTHSSGCNALIGALTNHPVLMDIGQASLTVATRKSPGTSKGLSAFYEVAVRASVDHLRRKSDRRKDGPPGLFQARPIGSIGSASPFETLHGRTMSAERNAPTFNGLWGESRTIESSPSLGLWSFDRPPNSKAPLEPVLATSIDSEAGASRMWSDDRFPKRRWTTTEPSLYGA